MSNSGWWNFERLYTDALSGVTDIDYSGRYVWAVSGTNVRLYDVYDLEQYVDQDLIDSYLLAEPDRDLTIYDTITIPSAGHHITCGTNCAYVSAGSDFTSIYKVEYNGDVTTITTPVEMQSNIHQYNGKLWMTGAPLVDWEQKLYSYDLSTETWSDVLLPIKHQYVDHYVHDDKAGNVLVTQFNNLSVSYVDAYTNTYGGTIRLDDGTGANREPTRIFTASDLTVYVCSINGMVSTIGTGSPITVDHEYNSLASVNGMIDDGTYLWFAAGNLLRQNKTDNDTRMTNGSEDDYSFNTTDFPSTGFTGLTKTISHSYVDENGTQTVGEYIFMTTATHVIAIRNDDKYYRTPYTKVNGVGMISSGKHDYTGD